MPIFRRDPGPCPICGVAHTACTADSGPVTVPQLPARDALAAQMARPTAAETRQATLPPEQVTTGTYRGDKKRR